MEIIIKGLLAAHIAFGFASLALFWLPVFLAKGSKWHNLTGKAYVMCMWVVVITAFLLSIKNLIIGKYMMAVFLGFISLITANPIWYGVAILKHKKRVTDKLRTQRLIFNGIIVLSGTLMVAWGIWLKGQNSALLLLIFGALGMLDFPVMIRELRSPTYEREWFKEHMIAMLTSGIAAFTAFLVFGSNTWLQELLPGYMGVLPWVLPGLIGGFGINAGVKYYRKKGVIT